MIVSGQQVAFTTPADAPGWQRWVVFSPFARLLAYVIVFIPGVKLAEFAMHALGWTSKGTPLQAGLGQMVGRIAPALVAYLVVACLIERRRPSELLSRNAPSRALAGLAAGTALFSAVVGVLWLLGAYHVAGINPQVNWVTPLLMVGVGAGVGEEIMFRGVLFRFVEEGLGTWAALIVSALFFGVAHIFNPGATLWSSLAITVEAGLLFGLLYNVTRSLPLCMGLHAAWNFCQGTVYGIPVSGLKADGWLVSTRSGPAWLSGGAFGAEASVVALTLCTLCSIALLAVALRRHTLVPPSWKR
ncbi:type II CAAX endopeptidase family protein [Rhodanobacter sp. DHG33]|uniref:CPBP family intramembrane glutamic endopeptidase n=1 Tax=Rhodanobacter sp. DHG33 TaxID=2775921 RepID=UPI00177B8F3E|nr:type II CAAX endopeptidase family protein [Rhodanobacter sp. DHG33]MBD8897629.1 CPBP family intramembrane metalloprotease [Rhodanobacter sp. DHG33]